MNERMNDASQSLPTDIEWMKFPTSKFSLRCEGEYKDPSAELLEKGVGR